MTAWYRAGTVTATNGSATVTGALTAWLANVKVGDAWCPDADGRGYEVTAVNSNTSITIFPVYAGTTGSGKAYGIARFSPNWNSVSEISVSLAEILAASSSILAGNGVPSDSLGTDGDVYFRQDVAEYYTKGSGTWTLVTSLIGPQGPAGPSYQATSTSSVAIGTGSKTFTVQSGRGYSAGQWVRVSNSSSNYIEGTVTSYSGTTLIINVPAGRAIGSGTYTSWNVNIAGDIGPANSLAIGSVTTGAAGSSASASITGSAPSQTLNLTIPRGNTGATGETGPQGATGAAATITVGTVDTVNPDDPATVTNSGTSGAAVFDFEIPKGDPGTQINHRGDYNAGTTYAINDAVRVLGSTWVYINATPGSGNAPPTLPTESNSYWQLMAQAGSNGTGAVDLVNGQSGVVVLDGSDIEANYAPVNYSPAGQAIADHFAALDTVNAPGSLSIDSVASAATCNIGAVAALEVFITGTTTITSFGTVANKWRIVRFQSTLTLTHNASTLILPGAANITTTAGDIAIFESDASGNWRCASYNFSDGRAVTLRKTLTTNLNYYVLSTGSDGNTGLANNSGGAFLTIQKALDIVGGLDLSIYNATINIGSGTFSKTGANNLKAPLGAGTVLLIGAGPTSTIVSVTSGDCFLQNTTGGRFDVRDLGLTTTTSGSGIYSLGVGSVLFRNLDFGACVTHHLRAYGPGSSITAQGNYSISGGANSHLFSDTSSFIDTTSRTATLSNTPAFSGAFAQAAGNALLKSNGMSFPGTGATGKRYNATTGGIIATSGGGANYFPGNSAGTETAPGAYL